MTTKQQIKKHNYFSDHVLTDVERFVRRARKDLKSAPEFDTLVVRGMSGAIAGGILARALKKNLYVIRKETDDSHDGAGKGFGIIGERWLFLDDFIGGGNTFWTTYDVLRRSVATVYEYRPTKGWCDYPNDIPVLVGAYLYSGQEVFDITSFQNHLITRAGVHGRDGSRILEELSDNLIGL